MHQLLCWAQGLQRGNTQFLFYVDVVWSGEGKTHINKYNVVWKVLRTTGEELGDSEEEESRGLPGW